MRYAVMAENRWNDKCIQTTKEALNAVLDYLFIFIMMLNLHLVNMNNS